MLCNSWLPIQGIQGPGAATSFPSPRSDSDFSGLKDEVMKKSQFFNSKSQEQTEIITRKQRIAKQGSKGTTKQYWTYGIQNQCALTWYIWPIRNTYVFRYVDLPMTTPDVQILMSTWAHLPQGKSQCLPERPLAKATTPSVTRKTLYWLVNRDPYNGLLQSLYNWGV